MTLPYRQFATWILGDIAERVASRNTDHVIFEGNHISRQYLIPGEADGESPTAHEAWVRDFWRRLPRGSDAPYRIALAVEAWIRAGEKSSSAASRVLDELRALPHKTRAERERLVHLGFRFYKTLEPRIGTTRRGRRKNRKKPGFSAYDREVEVVRTTAARFKRQHPEFPLHFEMEFGAYRSQFRRDAEWFAEAEPEYRLRLAKAEEQLGASHGLTAAHTLNLASLLHEQAKLDGQTHHNTPSDCQPWGIITEQCRARPCLGPVYAQRRLQMVSTTRHPLRETPLLNNTGRPDV